jgi:hypothetical protein
MTDKKRTYRSRNKSQYIDVKPENFPIYGKWLAGTAQKFKTGDVVRIGSTLGVVQFSTPTIGMYSVKLHTAVPNQWNYSIADVDEKFIHHTDEANPFAKHLFEDRYPGPSSEAMKKLSDAIDEARRQRCGKTHAELFEKTLEEEMSIRKNFSMEKDDDDDDDDMPIKDKSLTFSIEDDDKDTMVDDTFINKLQQEIGED